MADLKSSSTRPEFSLTSGGALHRLFVATRLTMPPMDLLRRRVFVVTMVAWLPLLVMSMADRTALEGVPVPFLFDIATHVRFLVALPMLLWAEYVVHLGMQPVVSQFLVRGIIPPASEPRFTAIVVSTLRLRDSAIAEVLIFALVLAIGHVFTDRTSLQTSTWYSTLADGASSDTRAGYWYSWVSIPIFQFIMLRWLFRWGLWVQFLWRVTRLPLRLIPTHPDRAAGLSFLSRVVVAFAPVLTALSANIAGVLAGRILYDGASLPTFMLELIVTVVLLALFALGPMCVFIPRLAQVRRQGEFEYGAFATHYVAAFDEKWNRPNPADQPDLLGTPDISGLADLAGGYQIVDGMRAVPFDRNAIALAAACAILPLAPLVLFIIPLDELVLKVLGILF